VSQHSGRPSSKSALSVDGTLRPSAWPPWAKRRSIRFNEHLIGDGPTVFEHVCRMGLEGIVSKRIDAPYRSGPSRTWLKSKNPASAAVRREREEEWC
jgi:ATP-dependent DNA ligase